MKCKISARETSDLNSQISQNDQFSKGEKTGKKISPSTKSRVSFNLAVATTHVTYIFPMFCYVYASKPEVGILL